MTVWAVVYRNYEPTEVDSLWATKELALRRVAELNNAIVDGWNVVQWTVGE